MHNNLDLILANTRPNGECLDWLGSTLGAGYAQLPNPRAPGTRSAHRRVYELVHGVTLTTSQVIMHSCDRPICISPEHLVLGSQAANMLDMNMKLRNGNRLLTPEAVRDIRSQGGRSGYRAEMAAKYGITRATAKDVATRRSWKWVS